MKQTYERVELIVSDDGSTDGSVEEIARRAALDSRVRLLRGSHSGMAAALNAAWAQSSGDIVCFLDADDTFLPNKVETVVRAFNTNSDVGYVIHRAIRTDHRGERFGVLPLLTRAPSGWCADLALANGGVLPNVPPTSSLSFRREVLEHIFPLPEELRGYAELVLQRVAPVLTKVLSLDQALATWRAPRDQ